MIEALRHRWQARPLRERRVLTALGLAAAALLYWALVWDPLAEARARLQRQTAAQLQTVLWLQQVTPLAGGMQAGTAQPALPPGKSLLRLVDETLRQQSMAAAIERIEPGQTGDEVRIWLRNVNFDHLAAWLQAMATEYGISGKRLSVSHDQARSQGLVTARVDMVQSG